MNMRICLNVCYKSNLVCNVDRSTMASVSNYYQILHYYNYGFHKTFATICKGYLKLNCLVDNKNVMYMYYVS